VTKPLLSIVLASVDAGTLLSRAIQAIEPQLDEDVELLVVVPGEAGDAAATVLAARATSQPPATLVTGAPGAPLPELRAAGLKRAGGEIVALLGKRYEAGATWVDAVRRAHERRPEAGAITGAIDPDPDATLMEWATHVAEYGPFMRPLDPGTSPLPAANVSFTADVARALADRFPHGAWETTWEHFLSERRISIVRDPAVAVRYVDRHSPREYLVERYDYARSITAERLAGAGAWRRAIYALACPLLPAVLITRMWRCVGHRREHRWRFMRALPWLILYTSCGAAGEVAAAVTSRGPTRARA